MLEIFNTLKFCVDSEKPIALATVIGGPGMGNKLLMYPDGKTLGDLGAAALNKKAVDQAAGMWNSHQPECVHLEFEEEAFEIFIDIFPPPPRLVIIGAVHIAIPLVTFANMLDFHTIVIDPRKAFATRERFPHADELIIEWPPDALRKMPLNESTYIVSLSHDEKLDNPSLQAALENPVRYIGALGSTRTHSMRLKALRELGIPEEELSRIHAPVGLDLGAKVPEGIALPIIAEIVAASHGISFKHLAGSDG